MKIRRLSEIDLARFCALPGGEMLQHALRMYNTGGGSWSYDPVRNSKSDILGAKTELALITPKVSWSKIAAQIARACKKGEEQLEANLEVAAVLYHFAEALGWTAVKFPMDRLPIGRGESVRYWSDIVIDDGEGPFIPFFDQRRANGLSNPEMRRIVFSLQHHHLRERHLDLADVRLAIVRFPPAGALRSMTLDFDTGVELLPFDQLNAKVEEVYREWALVSAEKFEKTRKTGTGGPGPLGI